MRGAQVPSSAGGPGARHVTALCPLCWARGSGVAGTCGARAPGGPHPQAPGQPRPAQPPAAPSLPPGVGASSGSQGRARGTGSSLLLLLCPSPHPWGPTPPSGAPSGPRGAVTLGAGFREPRSCGSICGAQVRSSVGRPGTPTLLAPGLTVVTEPTPHLLSRVGTGSGGTSFPHRRGPRPPLHGTPPVPSGRRARSPFTPGGELDLRRVRPQHLLGLGVLGSSLVSLRVPGLPQVTSPCSLFVVEAAVAAGDGRPLGPGRPGLRR